MLGINCLVNNNQLKDELKQVVQEYADDLILNDKDPSVVAVYRALRKDGFEIDAQTLGELYRDSFSGAEGYSNDDAIDAFTGRAYLDLMNATAEEMKTKTIGRESPVTAVVSNLMNQVKFMAESEPSLMRIFQDRLAKAAKRAGFEGETRQVNQKDGFAIMREVLNLEKNNPFGSAFSAMENARVLWSEFKKEFNEVAELLKDKGDVYNADKIKQFSDILEQSTYRFLMSTPEAQKVINDTLKSAGYTKEISRKDKTIQIVDWNKVFNDTDFDFQRTIKDVFRSKGFTENEVQRIADEMMAEFTNLKEAKLAAALEQKNKDKAPTPQQKTALQRLVSLNNLGIFQSSNQNALFKLLGVEPKTQQQIETLQKLSDLNKRLSDSDISQWTPSYLRTIEREIEIIIAKSEENRSFAVNAIRSFGMFNQLNSAMLLSNPQNATENILSGISQLFTTTLFTSPRHALQTIKVLFSVYNDVMRGGVREGQELSNSFNTSSNAEDRYNFETAKTASEKLAAGFNLLPRLLLSGMDNSIKAAMVHQIGIDMLHKELRRQGLSRHDATMLINKAFYGNNDEITRISEGMAAELKSRGININEKVKAKRIATELAWSNMASDGTFFMDVYNRLVDAGLITAPVGKKVGISESLISDLHSAAETAAAKGLGHQADSILLSYLDKRSQRYSMEVNRDRQAGRNTFGSEAQRMIYDRMNLFRNGAIKWMFLNFEKSSGFALLSTLLFDVAAAPLRNKLSSTRFGEKFSITSGGAGIFNRYSDINIDIDELDKEQRDNRKNQLEFYASLRQRIMRETLQPILSLVALKALQGIFSGNGDDDDKKDAMISLAVSMQEDRRMKRWFQKTFPPRAFNYLISIAQVNRGRVEVADRNSIKLPEDMSITEALFSMNDVLTTLVTNYNIPKSQSLIGGNDSILNKILAGKPATGELGEWLSSVIYTSPLKIYDVYKHAFIKNPIMSSSDYNQSKSKSFWGGVLKGQVNEATWNWLNSLGD